MQNEIQINNNSIIDLNQHRIILIAERLDKEEKALAHMKEAKSATAF